MGATSTIFVRSLLHNPGSITRRPLGLQSPPSVVSGSATLTRRPTYDAARDSSPPAPPACGEARGTAAHVLLHCPRFRHEAFTNVPTADSLKSPTTEFTDAIEEFLRANHNTLIL